MSWIEAAERSCFRRFYSARLGYVKRKYTYGEFEMDSWRDVFENKITTAEHAVSHVTAGSTVNIPIFAPRSLLDALWSRRGALPDVRLQFNAPTYHPGWFEPGGDHSFHVDF